MIAVVDDDAERRVEIGPAAAARERRSFMHDDVTPGVDQAHGRAQAGDARADNMNHAAVHRMPYRRRAPSRRRRLVLTRRRGGAKPSFSILSRIEPYAAAISRGAFTAARGGDVMIDWAFSKCS